MAEPRRGREPRSRPCVADRHRALDRGLGIGAAMDHEQVRVTTFRGEHTTAVADLVTDSPGGRVSGKGSYRQGIQVVGQYSPQEVGVGASRAQDAVEE